jgi:hypothetical protein
MMQSGQLSHSSFMDHLISTATDIQRPKSLISDGGLSKFPGVNMGCRQGDAYTRARLLSTQWLMDGTLGR